MAKTNTEIIQVLINGDYNTLAKEEQQQLKTEQFLKDFIQYLKNEEHPLKESELGSVNPESFFKYINRLIDLDTNAAGTSDGTTDYLNNTGTGLWNESVNKLIDVYKNKIVNNNGTWTVNGVEFNIDDILKGNAGKSFENTPWVHKNLNVDNKTYDDVRGTDKIISVLNNRIKMQFTHSQDNDNPLSKYIRLLMPQYTRRVEVEDLNRNFWVIGQTITALSAYLFDDDSPIKEMLKYLTSETTQLWENLIYLWTQVLFEKKEIPITDVRCEVVYLPNDIWNHEFKFDGYDVETVNTGIITNRLGYLVDQYPNKNLCIVPIVRKGNYFKNYYEQEIYPGIWCYDRNSKSWVITTFNGTTGVIAKKIDSDKLYYFTEENGYYKWYGADYEAPSKPSAPNFIQAIRSYIKSFSCDYDNGNFKVGLNVKIYDAMHYILSSPQQHNDEVDLINFSNLNCYNTANYSPVPPSSRSAIINSSSSTGTLYPGNTTPKGGIYLCEVPTKMGFIPYQEVQPIPGPGGKAEFKIVNIGSFFPTNILNFTHTNFSASKGFALVNKSASDSTTGVGQFDIETYGIGCYAIYGKDSQNNGIFSGKQYPHSSSPSIPIKFLPNKPLYENPTELNVESFISSNMVPKKYVTSEYLRNLGQAYIKKLVGGGLIPDKTMCITRIGVGYWTGDDGTVWSNGVFCDLFFTLNREAYHVCPMFLFDGYWTNASNAFIKINGSKWRQLYMTGTGSYTTSSSNPNVPTGYTLSGILQWNDHNLGSQQQNRPYCKYNLEKGTDGYYISYSEHDWGNYKGDSDLPASQMTMKIKHDEDHNIWSNNSSTLSQIYYDFDGNYAVYKPNVQDGYTLIGGKDAGEFIFATN